MSFKLSFGAREDIDEIFDYSISNFGVDRAIRYHNGLDNLFSQLVDFPNEGIERDELLKGLKSITYESHIVFYRLVSGTIIIDRVLHQRQNVYKHFKR